MQIHWQHVETIELVNDGSGLGFGIVGGKATGVIVKTILPGGVADQVSYSSRYFMFYTIIQLLLVYFRQKEEALALDKVRFFCFTGLLCKMIFFDLEWNTFQKRP